MVACCPGAYEGRWPPACKRRAAQAGEARGATACDAEPCAHRGKSPPCADALIKAGVGGSPAIEDPIRGERQGHARLRAAGIAVEIGEGYRRRRSTPASLPCAKADALSPRCDIFDGRIGTASGESKWITGQAAQTMVRAAPPHDAVLVGSARRWPDQSVVCRARPTRQCAWSWTRRVSPRIKTCATARTHPCG
jgi:diaminohydroxyphosphoribosylaminopyrimidine deaminase/5-amino-6-(5-phosphoribosylamino)uracil reductase